MLREDTVFGPIFSRRLGSSLGINLLPKEGKICNFDCVYCECGWNKDGLGDKQIPTSFDVRIALESKLKECIQNGVEIDSITFSGDGEPTLNPEFPQIIDDTIALRDKYFPSAKVSVLSNSTRVHIPTIFEALTKVDNPIMKIDAPTDELVSRINQPTHSYSLKKVIEALKKFNGNFVLQTMFLRYTSSLRGTASVVNEITSQARDDAEIPFFDSASPEVLLPWMDIVRELNPREIMVYTIARPTPAIGLEKYTAEQMKSLVQPLIDEGFNIIIKD